MRLWMMIASGKSLYQGSGGVLIKDIELSSAFVDEPPRLKWNIFAPNRTPSAGVYNPVDSPGIASLRTAHK